jgi:hypothetical protein
MTRLSEALPAKLGLLADGWWIFAPGAALPHQPQTHDASAAHEEAQLAAQQHTRQRAGTLQEQWNEAYP